MIIFNYDNLHLAKVKKHYFNDHDFYETLGLLIQYLFMNITNQNSVRYYVSLSYFTLIEVENVQECLFILPSLQHL